VKRKKGYKHFASTLMARRMGPRFRGDDTECVEVSA
jgi:hypothetical protein